MTYGLNRALPMTVIGFILGAGFVIVLRSLQQMDNVWDPQIGLIVGGLIATIFFLWGIGAYSPRMSEHHVPEPEEDEFGNEIAVDDHHHETETPGAILTSTVWTVAFWTMVIFGVLLIFSALPGGFGYTVSTDPAANANANGFFEFNWFGTQVFVSKLAAFVVFVAITMFSLFVAAWVMAKGLISLNHGVREVKTVGNQPLTPLMAIGPSGAVAALPSGEGPAAVYTTPPRRVRRPENPGPFGWTTWRGRQLLSFGKAMILDEPTPAHRRSTGERIRAIAIPLLVFIVLYWLFYEAAIGWIMPQTAPITVPPGITFGPYVFRILNSFVAVLLIVLLIFRTRWVLHIIGTVARFFARVLRGIPAFLFQRD